MRRRCESRGRSALLGLLLSWMLGSSDSAGASEFLAAVDAAEDCVPVSDSPASDSFANANNGASIATVTATAGPGFATFQVASSSEGTSTNFAASALTCYASQSIIDDIVITGPPGVVAIQLQANLNGTFSHSGPESTSAVSVLFARIRIGIVNPGAGTIAWVSTDHFPTQTFGTPLNTPLGDILLTPAVDVPTNVPLAIELYIDGRMSTQDTLNNETPPVVFGSADFSDGLRLPRNSPAFILPAGFRADSVDGQVVDNQFVGGGVPVPSFRAFGHGMLVVCLMIVGATGFRRFALLEEDASR